MNHKTDRGASAAQGSPVAQESPVAQGFSPASSVLVLVFALLAIANAGGYRYGASDQAFYIPAVAARIDLSLFPRDRPLLEAEGRLMVFDDGLAWIARATGASLPAIFLVAFLAGLVSLGAAIALAGSALYRSPWTVSVLLFALTLRHRIPRTGVNTLEGYLHPRMIAFAAGLFAIAWVLRASPWIGLACVAVAAVVHPTTAIWFAVLIVVAIAVDVPALRRIMVGVMATAAVGALLLIAGPLRDRLAIMDATWLAALQSKDYLFPAEWPLIDWTTNLAYAALIVWLFTRRRRAGLARAGERGLVAGSLVLLAIFLASVPFTMLHVAFAVQLQVSRIFWILDFLATAYAAWAIAEGAAVNPRRAAIAAAVVGLVAASRGVYVMQVEHRDRALIQRTLPGDAWTDVMGFVGRLPVATHVLADPGHAWKYGTSVRAAALRDVYLEDVKDSAIAMYSHAVADRVTSRIVDLPDFAGLSADRARALARKYDLDVLVIDRDLPLAERYRNARFRVYALR